MAEVDAGGAQLAESFDGGVVGGLVGGGAPALDRVRVAVPLARRVAGLAGQDDEPVEGLDRDRLVAGRVARRREDSDRGPNLVVAQRRADVGVVEVDPFEDRVVGVVGEPPLGRLDQDRDVRERDVLAGVIGMQVAVDDGGDVAWPDLDAPERVQDPSRSDVVLQIELGCPKPNPVSTTITPSG